MFDIKNFDALKIGLASPEQMRSWSNGEVKKPETINYRTLKPEADGLFCEKIFGPIRDWECYCGKYKRVRFKGIICERCGVEITRSKVRRERMGHIELAAPVAHIWFFKGIPSRLGYFLDINPKDLEKIIYFAAYVITYVNKKQREEDLLMLGEELEKEIAETRKGKDDEIRKLEEETEEKIKALKEAKETEKTSSSIRAEVKKIESGFKHRVKEIENQATNQIQWLTKVFEVLQTLETRQLIADEQLYRDLKVKYGDYFRGGMGAEAIKEFLAAIDLEQEVKELKKEIKKAKGQKKARLIKRLRIASVLKSSGNKPEWLILEVVPVIPPDLRPMVQLDGGRFATSDLNDLYRRVINRNNRLKRLLDLGAPEIIVNNEKRMLQEAVDALFDNGRRTRPVTGPGNRPLKSLSDMLKGKQGRFRQNLLGKRVDYSGRSVIVVGPELKLDECGLPKIMALELYKPFVMKRLVDLDHAQNIKSAKRIIERMKPVVWDVLEGVIEGTTVLLNRAPTLHRLGIQAFKPVLVEGKAIRIHPLVCAAFNADFDGDQMAVHLPLSAESQAEAWTLMLSTHNILSPAHGKPLVSPTQDIVLGLYYLTAEKESCKGEGKAFFDTDEVIVAYQCGEVELHAKVKVGINGEQIETTPGRVVFNKVLPEDHPFINCEINKKEIARIVEDFCDHFDLNKLRDTLDKIKTLGFNYATKAGLTMAVEDITIPPNKWEILNAPEEAVEKIELQYRKGLITKEERHQRVVDIWTKATEDVTAAMEENFDKFNPVFMMAQSGARGNVKQIRQLAGMRGLVANPKGDIIDRPIKANFREGLTVLEYFISTHGARKGLADTALRTADSGYLTRRLVDVSQGAIVREHDCGTDLGIPMNVLTPEGEPNGYLVGRVTLEKVTHLSNGELILEANQEITKEKLKELAASSLGKVMVRSILHCISRFGVCQLCYGWSLANNRLVNIGEAVGIIAAQSIGEPGTQLTMRTFHTGGVAGEDITHGLPRVVELFEARKPKGQAQIAEISGIIEIKETDKYRKIVITTKDGRERVYQVSRRARLRVSDGDTISAGDQLTEGSLNPHDILRVRGVLATELYLVREVQEVYKSQGVEIDDRHVELIVRQMLRNLTVVDSGDTNLLPGQLVDRFILQEENEGVASEGGKPAVARQILLGITKSSLATDSWLAAASFQETTRVLTDASISGKIDPLLGLKENVIISKLIPASTGMSRYREIKVRVKGEDDLLRELTGSTKETVTEPVDSKIDTEETETFEEASSEILEQ